MSTQDTSRFVSQQFYIYFGILILISGVIGGIFNIIIFITLKTFQETACGFYLTALSIVNIGQLLTSLFIRILNDGFHTDIRTISGVCKLHVYVVVCCMLVSMTIICLTTIDQYVSMSAHRHYSNKRLARRAVVLTCIVWGLYCILPTIYSDTPAGACITVNPTFAIYTTSFHLSIISGFLPLTTMTTFSLLAFNSARTLVRRQLNIVRLSRDRQLTAMTLCHVVFIVITTLPCIVFATYSYNQTIKDPEQIARIYLIATIIALIDYSSFAASFYIYCCVSERFRKQFKYVLMKVCVDRQRQLIIKWNNNQIAPNIEIIGDTEPIRTNRVAVEVASIQ